MKKAVPIPIHDFTRDDESSIAFSIATLEAGSHDQTGNPHRHNFYEIFLFQKGGGIHLMDFTDLPIQNTSIHFVSPGQVHQVKRSADSHGLVIFFSREFFLMEMQNKDRLFSMPFLHHPNRGVLNLSAEQFEVLFTLAKQMQLELQQSNPQSAKIVNAYLNIFLLKCSQWAAPNKPEQQKKDTAYEFKALLERNFRELHLVKDYATQLNVSPDQLNDCVRTAFGATPSELVTERLLLEAKRLVKYSDHSIKEIAYFLNFEDPAYFSRFFKNNTGMAPQEFRNEG